MSFKDKNSKTISLNAYLSLILEELSVTEFLSYVACLFLGGVSKSGGLREGDAKELLCDIRSSV